MPSGGKRPGAGRPVGSTNKYKIVDFFTDEEIVELVEEAKRKAKKDPILMKFLLEQLFGKAKQPLVGGDEDDNPIAILSNVVPGNHSNSTRNGSEKEN